MAELIKIEETLHHGETRIVRTVEVSAITETSVRGILLSSPYAYDVQVPSDHTLDPEGNLKRRQKMLKAMVEDLSTGYTADFGWSRFKVID